MNWTKDQLDAIDKLEEWLKLDIIKDLDHVFTLEGPAGTGKTTVVKEILDRLKGRYKVFVSAPTHKAKDVISKITGKVGLTIHSLLGLRPNLDLETYNPSNPTYASLAQMYIEQADIHIIDESSMINKELFKMLVSKVKEYRKRLIFIGDEYQLPPVNEKLSLAFMVTHKASLREIVRQKGSNPNHAILSPARDDVANSTNTLRNLLKTPIEVTHINEQGIKEGYVITHSNSDFYNRLVEIYSDSQARIDPNFVKTLVYTNIAAKRINQYIKEKVNPSSEPISEGDWLLGYKTVMKNQETMLIQNSSDYRVQSVSKTIKKIDGIMYEFLKVIGPDFPEGSIEILHPNSWEVFKETIIRIYLTAKATRRWRPFYAFKEKFIIMDEVSTELEVIEYGGQVVTKLESVCKKDIDLGYAMTIHKSQGSTYDNVAILYTNIIKACQDATDQRKLGYVAVSRHKNFNLIYG